MDVIADLLLRDVTLNNISKDVSGHIHMNKGLIDLEDELYKLLQQTALVDYLETEELSALLPENEIYISKIRFSDQDNLEASLTGENGMDCIYDKRTFMGIRNSLDIVKRICSMKVIFPQKKTDLAVKYEVISDKYMIVHILDGKHYNSDEFAEAWELYRKYEKRELMDICWQSVMNLSQRQCKNLSVEDISTKLDCDSETAITIINILHEKSILSIELHIYCDECSAENVVLCDGFNDSIVRCHNCGKQICASKDTCDSIKRYTIDKTALEEFIRRDYYDIYSNSKNTAKIIDFEPKIQAVELEEKASINENGEKSNAIVDEKLRLI